MRPRQVATGIGPHGHPIEGVRLCFQPGGGTKVAIMERITSQHPTLRRAIIGALSSLLIALPASAAQAMTTPDWSSATQGIETVHVVAKFHPIGNAHGGAIAINHRGAVFVTRTVSHQTGNVGRVLRVSPSEQVTTFGPRIRLGRYGHLTGIAVDGHGRVYAAATSYGPMRNRIYRVAPATTTVVASTVGSRDGYSAPQGLAFHAGLLYVADAYAHAIWRFRPSANAQELTTPWIQDPSLAARTAGGHGVMGIAFWNNTLFATNADKGLLVKVSQGPLGNPSTPHVVARMKQLVGAAGLAFDPNGHIWAAVAGTNQVGDAAPHLGQRILLLTRAGRLWFETTDARWMDYPNAIGLGRTQATRQRMFVLNGSRYQGKATLVTFRLH